MLALIYLPVSARRCRLRHTSKRVLVVHFGCAVALFPPTVPLPGTGAVRTSVDGMLASLSVLTASSGAARDGIWVCSANELLLVSPRPQAGLQVQLGDFPAGITAVSVLYPLRDAARRGVYVLPRGIAVEGAPVTAPVLDILYRCDDATRLRSAGVVVGQGGQGGDADDDDSIFVPVVCGIVFIDGCAAETFAGLHAVPAFEATTYLGADNGAAPLNFSLYLDLMLSCAGDTVPASFDAHDRETISFRRSSLPQSARHVLWQRMHQVGIASDAPHVRCFFLLPGVCARVALAFQCEIWLILPPRPLTRADTAARYRAAPRFGVALSAGRSGRPRRFAPAGGHAMQRHATPVLVHRPRTSARRWEIAACRLVRRGGGR